MSHGNKKQSAGRPYRGDLGQRPGDGYFVVPDRDDAKLSDGLTRHQTGEKGVRLPLEFGKGRNSNMTVVYGDKLEPSQEDDGLYVSRGEANDSGYPEIPYDSDARLMKTIVKKTINDQGGSNANDSGFLEESGHLKSGTIKGKGRSSDDGDCEVGSTRSRQDDTIGAKPLPGLVDHSTADESYIPWYYRCCFALFCCSMPRKRWESRWLYLMTGLACVSIPLIIWGCVVWLEHPEKTASNQTDVVASIQHHHHHHHHHESG